MFKKILVADDLSKTALKILQEALELARLCEAELTVLNVREDFLNKDEMIMLRIDVSDFQDEMKHKALSIKQRIEKDIESLGGQDLSVEICIREGKPGQKIVEFADDINADLVIMGSHGVSGLKEKVFGTTTRSILGHIKRPILITWTGN